MEACTSKNRTALFPTNRTPIFADGARLHILLAEDNPVNQKVAVRLLEKRGHTVEIAATGRAAVAATARQSFDLILMDLQMPEMGSLEATCIIRENEESSGLHVPIIAMTAHAMPGDRERCLGSGMDDYLSKPIDSTHLYAIVNKFSSARKQPVGAVHDRPSHP